MKTYTEADLAAAWESGYWHGTSHTGPLNDAAISKKNPHKKEDRDGLSKVTATVSNTETPSKESDMPTLLPPAGFVGVADFDGNVVDHNGPRHDGDGFKITTHWSRDCGLEFYIDCDNNNAFTLDQIRDILDKLPVLVQEVTK